jgi:hypothetical protein
MTFWTLSGDIHNAFAGVGSLVNENALKLIRAPFRNAADEGEAFGELAIAFESARGDLDLPRRIPLAMADVCVVNADQ